MDDTEPEVVEGGSSGVAEPGSPDPEVIEFTEDEIEAVYEKAKRMDALIARVRKDKAARNNKRVRDKSP